MLFFLFIHEIDTKFLLVDALAASVALNFYCQIGGLNLVAIKHL